MSRIRLLVPRRGVLGLLVDAAALVLLWQELFDFPVMLLDTNGEFEVFASDRVPVLFLDLLAKGERAEQSEDHEPCRPSSLQASCK